MNASLISVRPRFVDAIFRGEKAVELRRRKLNAPAHHVLFVYETAPVMAVRGFVRVLSVESGSVRGLWRRVGPLTAVTWSEYRAYFDGRSGAVAIHIGDPTLFAELLALSSRGHAPAAIPAVGRE